MSDTIILLQQDSFHVAIGLRELDEIDSKVVEVRGCCEYRPNIGRASVPNIVITTLGLVELDSEASGVQIIIEFLDRYVVTAHRQISYVQVVARLDTYR